MIDSYSTDGTVEGIGDRRDYRVAKAMETWLLNARKKLR